MKTEINLENKAKVFANYIGNQCYVEPDFNAFGVKPFVQILSGIDIDDMSENEYLSLKPLSSITDEDFLEVMWKQFPFQHNFKKGKIYHEHLNVSQADYLRSKGYALPWMGLSVDEMVQAGWIKLKNDE